MSVVEGDAVENPSLLEEGLEESVEDEK